MSDHVSRILFFYLSSFLFHNYLNILLSKIVYCFCICSCVLSVFVPKCTCCYDDPLIKLSMDLIALNEHMISSHIDHRLCDIANIASLSTETI